MTRLWSAIRFGLLDMRGDWRRFGLIIACLAVGTALIAGVSSVAASMEETLESNAALIMGGNIELSRADRAATAEEIEKIGQFGQVANVIDTNVRAEANEHDAFADLISVGIAYPLLGEVYSPQMPPGTTPFEFLSWRDGNFGALLDQLMLDQLDAAVGDVVEIGGTPFEVRGVLGGITDAPVRGFRLGLPAVITTEGFSILSDRTSPLPGLGTYFRYKVVLTGGLDPDAGKAAVETALNDQAWTVRTARDGLGPMVRYYDMFMRFLVIVGLASLLIGGVSVWTGMSAYISERAPVIAILRSMGARRARVFLHFLVQVATLAAIGVGTGLVVGGSVALVALPIVGTISGWANALHYAPYLAVLLVAFFLGAKSPQRMLALFCAVIIGLLAIGITSTGTLAMWSVLSVGMFCSVMWSNIFALAIEGLGALKSQASSLLVMAIVGGAALPLIQGIVADHLSIQASFVVPMVAFTYIGFYGIWGFKAGRTTSR